VGQLLKLVCLYIDILYVSVEVIELNLTNLAYLIFANTTVNNIVICQIKFFPTIPISPFAKIIYYLLFMYISNCFFRVFTREWIVCKMICFRYSRKLVPMAVLIPRYVFESHI